MTLLLWMLLAAGTNQPPPVTPTESKQAAEPSQPSMELLEFLGSFETIDGDWIDPMSFEEQYESDTKATANESDNNEISSQDSDPDAAPLH